MMQYCASPPWHDATSSVTYMGEDSASVALCIHRSVRKCVVSKCVVSKCLARKSHDAIACITMWLDANGPKKIYPTLKWCRLIFWLLDYVFL